MYSSINPNYTWKNVKDAKDDDVLVEGFYTGSSQGKYSYHNYFFESLTGEHVAVNGCASLVKAMEKVSVGQQCKVIFRGKKVLPANHKFAGRDAIMIEVLVARDTKSPTAAAVAALPVVELDESDDL